MLERLISVGIAVSLAASVCLAARRFVLSLDDVLPDVYDVSSAVDLFDSGTLDSGKFF